MKSAESLLSTPSKKLFAMLIFALCVMVCSFILAQPSIALAEEDENTVPQQGLALQNGDDTVDEEVDGTDTGDASGDGTETGTDSGDTESGTDGGNNDGGDDSDDDTDDPAVPEDPNKYLKDSTGNIITGAGWHSQGGKWYYTNTAGEPQKGLQTIGGVQYYLDPTTGVMLTGWQTISNNK